MRHGPGHLTVIPSGTLSMTLAHKLAEERRARLAAERLLEMKEAELFSANRKLGRHARALSDRIEKTEAEVATVRDENRKVKSDLSVAHQKIEIAERRLWHSIRTIRDGFAFFDDNNTMVGANDAYLSVFDGMSAMEPGVTYPEILQIVTEEGIIDLEGMSRADWRAMMWERWSEPVPEPRVLRLYNGQYIKVIDQRGTEGDVVSLALNITDTILYENRLKAARREAEAASRAKSAFLANMSHEIRTPMNGIVGMADLLAETDLDEDERLYVDTIRNSGEALLTIINDVLDYSKIEAEKLQLRPTEFDLEQCIHDVVRLLKPTAGDKGLQLLVDYDLFLPTQLTGDPGRIRQILTNILGNAVKFTTEGHVLISVTGATEGGICDLRITVQDTGIGIPADKVDHIFGEFNQVEDEKNRNFEGTGLGLAITKRLIEMMDGQIWVTSVEGEGTCFGFQIKLDSTNAEPLDVIKPTISKVMLVDPSEITRGIIEKQLTMLGLTCVPVASSRAAVDAFAPDMDLVIIDDLLGNMDGFELAQTLRRQSSDVATFVLAQNVKLTDSDPARASVDRVLQKPVPRQVLYRELMALKPQQAALPATQEPADPPSAKPMEMVFHARPRRGTPPDAAQSAPPSVSTQRKMRVLAAEDNKTNQLVFRKMLKAADIDLSFAANGHEAVQMYQDLDPDVVFMDISMPGMDGKEATQHIRALEEASGKHVPIIAMTAHAMAGDEDAVLAAGLDHYLTKPLKKAAVLEQLTRHAPADARAPLHDQAG